MIETIQLPVLTDNYVYLVHEPESGETAAVDPAEAEPVLRALDARGWQLSHVLNTHHHADHVGGNQRLKESTGCTVIASTGDRDRIPGIDIGVDEGDTVWIGRASAQVLAVPGHTRGHIAYWFKAEKALFCGDTLFAMGCGRLFEGSAAEMWASLDRLRQLPLETSVYCAHEYTLANARFALTVDPENAALRERLKRTEALRARNLPTVPSSLAEEINTNPFLRPHDAAIRRTLGLEHATDESVFAQIRRLKDSYRA